MRLNDACNLRWREIDLVSTTKTITYEPRKTGGEITVVVHPVLEDYLLSLPTPDTDDAFVFRSLAQSKSVSPLSKAFRKIMERALIAQSVIRKHNESGRTVYSHSFHSLRHSFSTILANSGVPPRRGQDAAHRPYHSQRSSEIYTPRPRSVSRGDRRVAASW
jgi:integrase